MTMTLPECEVCHGPILPDEKRQLVAVMGGYGEAHLVCSPEVCELCTGELRPDDARRSVMTPQGRRPVHEECHQYYLDVDAGKIQLNNREAKMSENTAVAKWDEKLAAMAQEYASGEHVGGDFLSLKGGVLLFQDEPMPGNQILCVILDAVTERTYYDTKYEAGGENLPPRCYAFGRAGDKTPLAPHPSMQADLEYFIPQNDECATCPHNEFGTSNTGRGKACSERRRLALLPAGYFTPRKGSRDFDAHLIEDVAHYEAADIALLKLNVMSVKDWARYVTTLSSAEHLPPMAVITRIYVEPDPKSQFRVKFEMVDKLPAEYYEVIMARHEEAKNGIIFGYTPPSGDAAKQGRSARRK